MLRNVPEILRPLFCGSEKIPQNSRQISHKIAGTDRRYEHKEFLQKPPPRRTRLKGRLTPANSLCLGPPFLSKYRKKPPPQEVRRGGRRGPKILYAEVLHVYYERLRRFTTCEVLDGIAADGVGVKFLFLRQSAALCSCTKEKGRKAKENEEKRRREEKQRKTSKSKEEKQWESSLQYHLHQLL